MRAAVYYRNDDIRVEEMPIPKIGSGELLLKISLCGICGSDVMEWYRIKNAPRVLGHEAVGVVAEVGSGVRGFKEGDRVFVSHHVPCGECHRCARGAYTACETLHTTNIDPGGFAEYARVPAINLNSGVLPLPAEVSDEEGVFIEPLGCVVRGQNRLEILPQDTILVLGSGVTGVLHIQLARHLGASRVLATDIRKERLRYAERFGADEAIDARSEVPSLVRELNEGRLADHAIVSTAALPAIKQAIASVDDGGNILLFAPTPPGVKIPLDLNDIWNRQLTITTTYAAAPSDLKQALELIRSRAVNVSEMVSKRLGLSEIQEGFRLVAEARGSLKIVVLPHQ